MQIILLVAVFLNLSTGQAFAYLDPGTGSYLLQLIIGGALGGIFILKNYWHSIMGRLSGKITKTKVKDNVMQPNDQETHN
jgi:hypothetical protein